MRLALLGGQTGQKYGDQIFSAASLSTLVISVSVLRPPATAELFIYIIYTI